MKELVFLLSADSDIQRAYERCEERQEGRGAVFMRSLDAAFEQIRKYPQSAPLVQGKYRRWLVPRFPYGIFYTVEQRGIIVVGVMDIRQAPENLRKRLT